MTQFDSLVWSSIATGNVGVKVNRGRLGIRQGKPGLLNDWSLSKLLLKSFYLKINSVFSGSDCAN